jgi:hypothetical protein
MDYVGQWGGGGPGRSWALKWQRADGAVWSLVFIECDVCNGGLESSFEAWRSSIYQHEKFAAIYVIFRGGGGG